MAGAKIGPELPLTPASKMTMYFPGGVIPEGSKYITGAARKRKRLWR